MRRRRGRHKAHETLLDIPYASHDGQLFFTELEDIGLLGRFEGDGAHLLLVPPQRRSQIDVDRDEDARLMRRSRRVALRGAANGLAKQQAAGVQNARVADDVRRDLRRGKRRFSAALSIEREVPFAVRGDSHNRERRVAFERRQHALRRHSVPDKRRDEELSEGVVTNLAQHCRATAKPRDAHRDIPRGAARLGSEIRFSGCTARWHKVDNQFPKGDNVETERSKHGAALFATREQRQSSLTLPSRARWTKRAPHPVTRRPSLR
jgi:hypothetical protein